MGRPCIISKEYHQEIIDLYKTGDYSMTEIAKMYGATNRQPVITILKQNNIETIDRRTIQGNDLQKVEQMANGGLSKRAIAIKLNVSDKAISTAMDRLGIEYEPQIRTYHFDETIFDVIDTEEKAYWLGFSYADAHANRTSTRLCLGKVDIDHVVKFRNFINGNMPIVETMYDTREISLNSIYLVKRMHELGIIPYRGKFNKLTKDKIPQNLIKHFIRGYIDGDGCISNDFRVLVTGKQDILTWINDILNKEVGAKKNKFRIVGNTCHLGWGGRHIFNAITEYLYKDASIFLDRKMKRIKNQANW